MDPFVQLVKDTPDATPLIEDQFQSISAQSQYDKHSHEVRFLSTFYLTYSIFWTFSLFFFLKFFLHFLLLFLVHLGITSCFSSLWSWNDFSWTPSTTKPIISISICYTQSDYYRPWAFNSFCICGSYIHAYAQVHFWSSMIPFWCNLSGVARANICTWISLCFFFD